MIQVFRIYPGIINLSPALKKSMKSSIFVATSTIVANGILVHSNVEVGAGDEVKLGYPLPNSPGVLDRRYASRVHTSLNFGAFLRPWRIFPSLPSKVRVAELLELLTSPPGQQLNASLGRHTN